jgi:FixJ family two-component response regulator
MVSNGSAREAPVPLYFIGDDKACTETTKLLKKAPLRHFVSVDVFLSSAARLARGYLLLDVDSAGPDAPEAIGGLRRRSAVMGVIAQTASKDVDFAVALMRNGAVDVMLKPVSVERLSEAIGYAARSRGEKKSRRAVDEPIEKLSNREREVLDGLSRGLTNKVIAAELGISHRTVEIHRAHLMRKIGATSLPALLTLTYQHRDKIVRRK